MRKLLLLSAALPVVAFAQATPPDVTFHGYVAATYAAGSTPNVVATGTPPALADQPADIPSSTTVGKLLADGGENYCTEGVAGTGTHGCTVGVFGSEQKMRTEGTISHILYDDPIRNYGQPGTSHCHEFFGAKGGNAFSTYSRLRNRQAMSSTMGGKDLNNSLYWIPCPVKTNPFSDGKNYAVLPDIVSVYYRLQAAGDEDVSKRHPRGLRMVWGTNMDDPDDLAVKAEIAAANAQSGTAGRYSYPTDDGFVGWTCFTSVGVQVGGISRHLKNADNSDPWAGACTAGGFLVAQLNSAQCWDGANLWVPGGYRHFRQLIRDNTLAINVCPNGWYKVPVVEVKPQFTHQGFSDYGSWRLSSDNAAATVSGHSVLNGASMHTDEILAWDDTTLNLYSNFCLAVGGGTYHECNGSTVSATQRLVLTHVAAATYTHNTGNAAHMKRLPTGSYAGTVQAGGN